MTRKEAERQDAIRQLKELIKPGDTVKTILRHVSRSGMTRAISPVVDGEDISWLVARTGSYRFNQKHGGLTVGGCGMDMGFALIYELSYTLYHEYQCVGDHGRDRCCPSADHVNPRTDKDGNRTSPYPRDGKMMHKDGYAISQRWL